MRIFLVRHGEQNGGGDANLTEKGIEQIKVAAELIKNSGIEIDKTLVFSSFLARARESAAIISGHLLLGAIVPRDWLSGPGVGTLDFLIGEVILQQPNVNTLIVVTHQPLIEELLNKFGVNDYVGHGSVFEVDFANNCATRKIS